MSGKAKGRSSIEYYGDFVPEQWITAAGAESYLIMKGGDPQAPEATLDYSLRFMNPLAASMVGNYLRGVDRVMPMADGVAIQQHDCHYGRMTEILEFKGVPVYKVGVPADNVVGISQQYYRHELREFRDFLEKVVGHPLDEKAVHECYAKTNKINELVRKIGELRKKDNSPITFSDFIRLNHYTLRVDYDTSIDALTKIYEELKDAPGAHPEGAPRIRHHGPRRGRGRLALFPPSSRPPAAPSSATSWTRPSAPIMSPWPPRATMWTPMPAPCMTTVCLSACSSRPGRPALSA